MRLKAHLFVQVSQPQAVKVMPGHDRLNQPGLRQTYHKELHQPAFKETENATKLR
jgi:hypothetical protein